MQEHNLNPGKSFLKDISKDNTRLTQLQIINEYLKLHVATASMVSTYTGVPHKNITRYKRALEKAGQLWEITKATCKESGFKAHYLTCDKAKAPKRSTQLNLF